VPESTPAASCVFLTDLPPESKICEKPDVVPESLFIFRSRSLCGFPIWHFLSNNIAEFRCINDSRSLNKSWILEFENFSDSDPDSKLWNRSEFVV